MSSMRMMQAEDLFDFDTCNLDPLTETYNIGFYLEYLAKWPDLCWVIESESGQIEAYILGKVESSPHGKPSKEPYHPDTNKNMNYLPWHAHITALTVAPHCRRRGHAQKLSTMLEDEGVKQNAWFVDLFVRKDNVAAIALYKSMGYSVFRRVRDYYSDGTDALDMRKALPRDKKRQTIRENGDSYIVEPQDVWDREEPSENMKSLQLSRCHRIRIGSECYNETSETLGKLFEAVSRVSKDPYDSDWAPSNSPTPTSPVNSSHPTEPPAPSATPLSRVALHELNKVLAGDITSQPYTISVENSHNVAENLEALLLGNLTISYRAMENSFLFFAHRLFARRDGWAGELIKAPGSTGLTMEELELATINVANVLCLVIEQMVTTLNNCNLDIYKPLLQHWMTKGIRALEYICAVVETSDRAEKMQDWNKLGEKIDDLATGIICACGIDEIDGMKMVGESAGDELRSLENFMAWNGTGVTF